MATRSELISADDPINLVDLGEISNVSRATLYRLTRLGRLAYSTVDGQVRAKPSQYDEFVTSNGGPVR